jgi:hypothetical protein
MALRLAASAVLVASIVLHHKRIARHAQKSLDVRHVSRISCPKILILQSKVLQTSDPGSDGADDCHTYKAGDPAPTPSSCVDNSQTLNQPTCRKYALHEPMITRLTKSVCSGHYWTSTIRGFQET